jgi:hypothetical protein
MSIYIAETQQMEIRSTRKDDESGVRYTAIPQRYWELLKRVFTLKLFIGICGIQSVAAIAESASTATASATTAESASAATAETASAAPVAFFSPRSCLIDDYGTSFELFAVQLADRSLSF